MMEVTNTSSNIVEPDEWTPITPPDGWVLLPSVSPSSESPPKLPIHTTESSTTTTTTSSTTPIFTTTEPVKISPSIALSTSTSIPSSPSSPMKPIVFPTESTSLPSVQLNETSMNITTPKVPTLAEKINASITNMVFSSTASSINENDDFTMRPELNMSDYREVCGRRMYPQARIVGGKNSTFGRWPWQISLRQWRTSTYLHKCGAALLNENWAITAAHCVDSVPPSDLLLRLGEHDLTSESEPYGFQERRVQIVASHPQFDPRTFEYDLALLRFYEPVTFQPNIIPVCVPNSDEGYVGKTAHVTGWGRLHEDGPLPNTLQEVSVPVINNSVCEQMYRSAGYIEHIPNIFICAGLRSGGSDSCEGDSGGPMVIQRSQDKRFILAGVISWGIGCAEPNQPGVYTRISEFRHWINQILQF
ncbi:serine proteinase stubble-like [Chrysoperla carnea]|uniref:serine proteinase stubble-like n=1 Tax=Chrysoperla carnea TaxID=189513 RepID=UPI001D080DFB|nr:serine proteinase stubble-like [Chrysoperla carnea]